MKLPLLLLTLALPCGVVLLTVAATATKEVSHMNKQTTATYIVDVWTNSTQCQQGTSGKTLEYYTGVCYTPYPSSSLQYFCDTTAAYFITYSSTTCDESSITNIQRTTYGCDTSGGENGGMTSQSTFCQNPELGPSLPFSYPPAGFIVTSSCTNNNSTSTCQEANQEEDVVCVEQAAKNNECVPTSGVAQQQGVAQKTFCTADSYYVGVAEYSTSTCDSSSLLAVSLQTTSCNATVLSTQCTGAPLDQVLPRIGVAQYAGDQCSIGIESLMLYPPNVCDYGQSISCSDDGTQYVVTEYQTDSNATSLTCQTGPFAQESNTTYSTMDCLQYFNQVYFCEGIGPLLEKMR